MVVMLDVTTMPYLRTSTNNGNMYLTFMIQSINYVVTQCYKLYLNNLG